MDTITTILLLLLAVVVSGVISRMVPSWLPRPLVQIAFGAAISFMTATRVELNPEIFFLLFLPPLLFLDGWRIPREELFKDGAVVLELALGLVLFTVVGMGLLIHWLIPALPLAVSFALAAVISPTDPIAVSAIAKRVPIPKRMMHILEGESLLNDASALVCLRFAIAAALTGSFSIADASLTFIWLAIGGISIGVAVTLAISKGKDWIARRFGEESGSQILISILIPFAAYLAAEHVHCSGILAAVAAGITMSVTESSGLAQARTRIERTSVWDMIQFAANGVIFVILGEQLPFILAGAADTVAVTGHSEPWWLAIYVVSITAGLAALRFAWVWVSFRISLRKSGKKHVRPDWRIVGAMSFAGVRGAITLAGVLTLPLALNDGTPFPGRDLAIFIAMGVIILSLIIASLGLPFLLRDIQMPEATDSDAEAVRIAAAEAAIAAIELKQHALVQEGVDAELVVAAAARSIGLYRDRIRSGQHDGDAAAHIRAGEEVEMELRRAGLKAEREEVFRRHRLREIGSEATDDLVVEIDLMDARLSRH